MTILKYQKINRDHYRELSTRRLVSQRITPKESSKNKLGDRQAKAPAVFCFTCWAPLVFDY
ncbi:MAG: hypothetical protein UT37_C0005G0018 [Parcubacteria group bacterium GW2011_GWA2_39_18]|nr:MAG: hypothetical protein UT37_C0005G0018 [Parcubacteria group bacterium GW2011_GWA2_39_18]